MSYTAYVAEIMKPRKFSGHTLLAGASGTGNNVLALAVSHKLGIKIPILSNGRVRGVQYGDEEDRSLCGGFHQTNNKFHDRIFAE
ncbi:hypothetical protein EDC04DRAFT_2673720 [Pisolithus marmoratus]|nr:hypothetical protein EDC04DRAFT_2673720 [Pisolithus marmoratus]